MLTIPRLAARPAGACRPLSPSQRAEVRKALARAVGDGRPATREDVARELLGGRQSVTAPAAPVVDVVTPGVEVAVCVAAGRLGLAEKTVRRYLAPSSGKLARVGAGVCPRSVERFEAAR